MAHLFSSALTLCLLLQFHLSKVSFMKHNDLFNNSPMSEVSSVTFPALLMETCLVDSVLYSQLDTS